MPSTCVITSYSIHYTKLYEKTGQQAYWRDVGTLDAFWGANMELVAVTPQLDMYDKVWPIYTHQTQDPPAKFVFDEPERRGYARITSYNVCYTKLLRARAFSGLGLAQPFDWIAPLMILTLSPRRQLGGVGWVNRPLLPFS